MDYISSLDVVSRDRYEENIKLTNTKSPYNIEKVCLSVRTARDSVRDWLQITYPDNSKLSRSNILLVYLHMMR